MKSSTPVLAVCLFVLTGCPRDKEEPLTLGEAAQALEEASYAGQAEGLTSASVDIATNFTIGQAVSDAAAELRTFVESQLPCAEIALEAAKLSIEYGAKPRSCEYRGHSFSGTHRISIAKNQDEAVEVHHEWIDFSNGVVSLDGTADVTWNFSDETRRVEHQTSWVHLRTGRTGSGSGDRTQSLLSGGLAEGIRIDGARTWTGERGTWELAIDGVELRWTDPVPQSGSYTLLTPSDKTLSLAFVRVDGDTIRVTVTGTRREFAFTVSKLGEIVEDQ